MPKKLADRDPEEIALIPEALELMGGISRATLYRLPIPRHPLSPGPQVGIRIGDIQEYLASLRAIVPVPDGSNFYGVIAGTEADLGPFLRHRLVLVFGDAVSREAAGFDVGPVQPTSIRLPPAKGFAGRELVLVDHDGVASSETPIEVLPAPGEQICRQGRWVVDKPYGSVRLVPVLFGSPEMPDGWWVA